MNNNRAHATQKDHSVLMTITRTESAARVAQASRLHLESVKQPGSSSKASNSLIFNSSFVIRYSLFVILFSALLLHTPARAAELPATAPAAAAASGPLSSSVDFFKKEGAHFNSPLENWQLTGVAVDSEGKKYDFAVVFMQSGTAMMNLRNGYASFHPAGGDYFHTAFVPPSIRDAVLKEITKRQIATPDDKSLKADFDSIQKGEYPHIEVFPGIADVFQTLLYINYGKNHFERTSKTSFTYSLLLDVQGNQLALELTSSTDPDLFDGALSIPVGIQGGALSAYCFPELKINGTLLMADHKVRIISGTARFLHLWGEPDRAAFGKYTFISQTLDNGRPLYVFNFYTPNGMPLSTHILTYGPDGKLTMPENASALETESFTAPLSNINYPNRWDLKAGKTNGAVTLTGKSHELDVAHGVGEFYLGPCGFTGTGDNNEPVLGTGDCRLVSVEKKAR